MKYKITFTSEYVVDIDFLANWEASTLDEAVAREKQWLAEDSGYLVDAVSDVSFKITKIESEPVDPQV
jgi:hypothetical protein